MIAEKKPGEWVQTSKNTTYNPFEAPNNEGTFAKKEGFALNFKEWTEFGSAERRKKGFITGVTPEKSQTGLSMWQPLVWEAIRSCYSLTLRCGFRRFFQEKVWYRCLGSCRQMPWGCQPFCDSQCSPRRGGAACCSTKRWLQSISWIFHPSLFFH